ncbi:MULTISPECIES: hypothetical protein [unclassified Neisseria]|uniref:hypothetical protein n=1 Tax=unclassified Neisseria TaxID=2623750 RepID=UPI001071D59E|nr:MULTISPECIES: hypothetical protein [unclassified Neisseria]MBF0803250.1 hypothetical protein [Neisseria sp. 19428wB4_WF04]TFU44089.1 hypothetical protein E4T99_02575 [Neisseria sp. WF04]
MAFKSWFAAALLLSPPLAAQEIKAEILSKMAVSPAELAEVCRQLPKCDKDSGGLFKRKSPEAYYFIDHTPQLARFTKGSAYQLKQRWDFADYVHGSEITRAASDPACLSTPRFIRWAEGNGRLRLSKGLPTGFRAAPPQKRKQISSNSIQTAAIKLP